MRHGDSGSEPQSKINWKVFSIIWPYLLEYRVRVFIAVSCLVLSKAASVSGPFLLKNIVDTFTQDPATASLLTPIYIHCAEAAIAVTVQQAMNNPVAMQICQKKKPLRFWA